MRYYELIGLSDDTFAKYRKEELAKRQEIIKKHTNNGKIDLYIVFKEYYEWLAKKDKNNEHRIIKELS